MTLKNISLNNAASIAVLMSALAITGCGGGGSSSDGGTENNDPVVVDTDNDGVQDSSDNCVNDANADQADADNDGTGDVCDSTPNGDPVAADEGTAAYVAENLELKGDFDEDVTLIAGNTYKITGEVNFLEGTTLTIPAGTTLYGSTGASYLAINRGAMIDAQGTSSEPIIFTSAEDIAGTNTGNEQGQWGGLTILGQSTNNKGERTYEAGTQLYGPKDGVTIENDDSGTLSYVAIKYSGFEVEQDKELNGLSLGSVGSGTTINNIAIIGSADDGIEFWGGTVDVNGLYIYNAGDDSIDTDQGYVGTLSNVYAEQNIVDDETGSRVIEADSFDTSAAGTPVATPTLENAILKSVGRAVRLREGTQYVFDNVQIIVDSSTDTSVEAIRVSDTGIGTGATVSGLAIKNNANPTALFSTGSKDQFTGQGFIYEDTDTALTINAYSATWAGAADNSANSVSATPAAEGTALYVAQNDELKGDFSESVTLDASKTYKITGEVNFLEGTTLTIPAGTTLYGSTGASYLAINRGAMIDAQGTVSSPIIFTSAEDIAGINTGNEQGQWGGLTILGQSVNNKGERTYEAGTQLYGPKDGVTISDDNSGTLNYVAIKYSGFEVEQDKELNGLSLGSVGSGTTISNIAIIGSADDGIEFWGGTVSVDGLYIYNAGDDSIDTDQGYVGTLSNVYAEQNVVDDETGSRVIEADSFDTSEAGTPVATPTLTNAILKSVGRAVRLREGTNYVFDNVQIIVDSSTDTSVEAIRVSDTGIGTGATVTGSGLAIKNTVNASALFSTGSEAEFSGANIFSDTDTALDINAYSATWAGAADNSANSVSSGPAAEGTALYVAQNNELKGDFAENVTLDASNTYKITGEVNFLEGTTLTIPAGTTLYGSTGASYLAINRGAMIDAQGTAVNPIIFTSAEDIAGINTGNEQGQWGGLTILGQSVNNKGERTYEAGTQLYGPKEGVTISDDNSGTLSYVAIKYSGFEVEQDKELNGLSLGSVGSGTTINNIAIIGSADDGIEFWGGTVSVNGLYIYNAGDDSIDTDQGYVGTLNNVYAEQNVVDDEIGSRVIEADSFDTSEAGTPVATPTLQNAILKSVGRAVRLREGTNYVFDNVQIIVESSTDTSVEAIRVSDTGIGTGATVSGSGLAVKNTVNSTALFTTGSEAEFDGLAVLSDDDTTLTITEYDASWAN